MVCICSRKLQSGAGEGYLALSEMLAAICCRAAGLPSVETILRACRSPASMQSGLQPQPSSKTRLPARRWADFQKPGLVMQDFHTSLFLKNLCCAFDVIGLQTSVVSLSLF